MRHQIPVPFSMLLQTEISLAGLVFPSLYSYHRVFPFKAATTLAKSSDTASELYFSISPSSHNLANSGSMGNLPRRGAPAALAISSPLLLPHTSSFLPV